MIVSLSQARRRLTTLLSKVENGEDVIICRSGKPIAKLTAPQSGESRVFGRDVGVFTVPSDFDAPLPNNVQHDFEH